MIDGPGDMTCIMYGGTDKQVGSSRANREFATVRIFPLVAKYITVRKSEGIADTQR